jgi:hypothetical protein
MSSPSPVIRLTDIPSRTNDIVAASLTENDALSTPITLGLIYSVEADHQIKKSPMSYSDG